MNKEQRRFLIIALIISFGFATDRLVRFYYNNVPIANAGECIEVPLPGRGQFMLGRVVSNDVVSGTCTISTESFGKPAIELQIPYSDLRDLEGKKVSCDEKAD